MSRYRNGFGRYGFQPELLPRPVEFYESRGLRLRGHGDWRSALCPFHDDTTPSLRIHTGSGGYRCMACGAKGGGIVDFVRASDGVSFKQAAKALGAYVEDPALGGAA